MSETGQDRRSESDAAERASVPASGLQRKAEQGPRILFFSGGSAIRRLSRRLIRHTHNSIHIITPFDSGGSSATLRHAFGMPAVGDLRNRLLALADPSSEGHPDMCRLAAYRFDHSESTDQLRGFLEAMCLAQDARVSGLPSPQKTLACRNLRAFSDAMPDDFDLRGASIGNLIITGSWLRHGRQLDPALSEFSRMIGARGTVRPVVEGDFHLAAALEDGSIVRCQHRITGKEAGAIAAPIRTIWITDDRQGGSALRPTIDDATADLIAGADLICYPPGSFYTSVLVNLLPKGVSTAIARASCHKVYLPGLGHDSEALGLGVFDAATRLVQTLEDGLQTRVHPSRLLDRVIVDTIRGEYASPVRAEPFLRLGIGLIDIPLLSDDSAPLIDERLAIDALLSLV